MSKKYDPRTFQHLMVQNFLDHWRKEFNHPKELQIGDEPHPLMIGSKLSGAEKGFSLLLAEFKQDDQIYTIKKPGLPKRKLKGPWFKLSVELSKNLRGGYALALMPVSCMHPDRFQDAAEELQDDDIYIHAVLRMTSGGVDGTNSGRSFVVILSRETREDIFVADINNRTCEKQLISNFVESIDGKDLTKGILIPTKEFRGIENAVFYKKSQELKLSLKIMINLQSANWQSVFLRLIRKAFINQARTGFSFP